MCNVDSLIDDQKFYTYLHNIFAQLVTNFHEQIVNADKDRFI